MVENSNSSIAANSEIISSRRVGHNRESQATARRFLQIADDVSFPSAIPPLSPPGLEDIHLEDLITLHPE